MDKKILQHTILESAYNREVWLDVLKEFFGAKRILQQPKKIFVDGNKAEYAVELGSFYTADEKLVGIFEVKLMPLVWIERNRVGLRSLLRQVYKYDVDGALIVFVQDNKWRFSYVSEIRTEEGKKETEPKRYTYLFGKGESCRTAAERFDKLKGKPVYLNDLYEAFSVEKLNKDFFKTYKEFNEKFWNYLAENKFYYKILYDNRKEIKDDEVKKTKPIRDFSKKLLGRIVFLHFLQKKGWMGVPLDSKEWKNGDPKFLQNLFANCKDKSSFHSKVLKVLFFKTLNTKRTNDIAPTLLGKDIKIPYLNGGLFDKDISFEYDFDFPEEMFAKLLDFFEQYNFTIDENDPYDSEVGIDPEMLGHIFENLLEENREKGAFYTPKEIVHYMCQESLLQYLRTHLPECTEDESSATIALQNFIRKGETGDRTDRKNFVVQQAKRIERLLDNAKICDPAIGSGAFPMGMLQEIFKAKTALDLTLDHTEVKKQIIQNCIYGVDIENGAVEIARLRFWLALVVDEAEPQPLPNLDYKIMQGNSLLESFEGVDLSNLADMDKEETFLSAGKQQLELGADFSVKKQSMLVFDQKSKTQLYELIADYYNYDETTNTKYKSKQFIKDEINNIVEGRLIAKFYLQKPKVEQRIKEIQNGIKANRLMAADAPGIRVRKEKNIEKLNRELQSKEAELEKLNDIIEHLHELQTRTDKPYFLWHLWFKEVFDKGGFDIVIGNPPYIEHKKLKDIAYLLRDKYKVYSGATDISAYFFELGFNLLKKKGTLQYISSNKFFNTGWGKELRKYLLENKLKFLVNFEQVEVFEGVLVSSVIVGSLKEQSASNHELKYTEFFQDKNWKANFDEHLNGASKSIRQNSFDENEWTFADESQILLKKKIEIVGTKIKDLEGVEIKRGVTTGYDPAFIIENDDKLPQDDKSIIKLLLKGRDIKKYMPLNSKSKLLFVPWHYPLHADASISGASSKAEEQFKKKYPSLYKHFQSHYEGLAKRNQEETGIRYEWYALQRCAASYFELFDLNKIVWALTSDKWGFALDTKKHYLTSGGFFLVSINFSLNYILGVLNSKLMEYYFKFIGVMTAGGAYTLKKATIEEFPIATAENKKLNQIEILVSKILELKKEKLPTSNYENKIDALVFHLYGLSESEMLQVLDTFKDLSIKDRNQIQNEYWNIANNKFKTEV